MEWIKIWYAGKVNKNVQELDSFDLHVCNVCNRLLTELSDFFDPSAIAQLSKDYPEQIEKLRESIKKLNQK